MYCIICEQNPALMQVSFDKFVDRFEFTISRKYSFGNTCTDKYYAALALLDTLEDLLDFERAYREVDSVFRGFTINFHSKSALIENYITNPWGENPINSHADKLLEYINMSDFNIVT